MTITDSMAALTPMESVPFGFKLVLDQYAVRIDHRTVLGGQPTRLLRLSAAGADALDTLLAGSVRTATEATLARRLTDAGVLHPVPPVRPVRTTTAPTVVIPVFGRADQLDACLRSLGRRYPVVVVDDASPDPVPIQRVCDRHGARLLRRQLNGGPAAARNAGLSACTGEVVILVDSDCIPTPGAIDHLAAHLADPLVAAAAPRMTTSTSRSVLDLGTRPSLVHPRGHVSHVPTALLAVRRSALLEVGDFNPALRVGEDVDLIWRLVDAGWRVRYDPSVTVRHDEPRSMRTRARRRFRYGTSAGPLALRHQGRLHHLSISRRTAPVAIAAALGSPALTAAALIGSSVEAGRNARAAGVARRPAARHALHDGLDVWTGLGTWSSQLAAPLLALALVLGSRRRRAVTVALLLAPAFRTRSLTAIPDNVAYGAGVWTGSVRARTIGPLLVQIIRPHRTPS